jgi:hypothetical protein
MRRKREAWAYCLFEKKYISYVPSSQKKKNWSERRIELEIENTQMHNMLVFLKQYTSL